MCVMCAPLASSHPPGQMCTLVAHCMSRACAEFAARQPLGMSISLTLALAAHSLRLPSPLCLLFHSLRLCPFLSTRWRHAGSLLSRCQLLLQVSSRKTDESLAGATSPLDAVCARFKTDARRKRLGALATGFPSRAPETQSDTITTPRSKGDTDKCTTTAPLGAAGSGAMAATGYGLAASDAAHNPPSPLPDAPGTSAPKRSKHSEDSAETVAVSDDEGESAIVASQAACCELI